MIDLHMHSCYSDDGQLTPAQLVQKCRECGVEALSVTDHNCARANAEAAAEAQKYGLRYLPGIEIDCLFEGVGFHLLGYGIDYESPDFARIEANVDVQEQAASRLRLQKTQALGFCIQEGELRALAQGRPKPQVWTGEMFAEALLASPAHQNDPRLWPYRPGGARSDNPLVNFYWDYYAQGKPCHAAMVYPSMERAIEIIHQNHGWAVLAHPGVNLKGREYLLERLCALPLDGIEAYSSYHTPEQARGFHQQAQAHGLLVTCGSDFHGKTKPAIALSAHGALPELEKELQERGFFEKRK